MRGLSRVSLNTMKPLKDYEQYNPEEQEEDYSENDLDSFIEGYEEKEDEGEEADEQDDYNEGTKEDEIQEDTHEAIRLSDGSKEIYLGSSKTSIKELKKELIELLQNKEVIGFLKLNNHSENKSYVG